MFDINDINNIMTKLAEERQVFHSEADFQFALAWKIKEEYPDAKIRLEKCVRIDGTPMYIDIIVEIDDEEIPIELKYKTRNNSKYKDTDSVTINGEDYTLKNQGAQTQARYDFVKDISRIEMFIDNRDHSNHGYAIMLTNDQTYYQEIKKSKRETYCDAFRIHAGRNIEKKATLEWADGTSKGTKKGRDNIEIKGSYKFEWNTYSSIKDSNENEQTFKYLIIEVKKNNIGE